MSDYLQRLVHTASHPHETIHPRTGSLFAPFRSAQDPNAESFEQVEGFATYPVRFKSSTATEPAETVQQPADSAEARSSLRSRTVSELPRTLESMQRPDVSRPAGSTAQHEVLDAAIQVPPRLVAPQDQHDVPHSRRNAGDENYMPLIHPQRSEAHNTRPETPQFSTEARGTRKASANPTASRLPARVERAPDEIQIHIGRIEVTAVQPPAPRAPKPPDRTISLDAYLGRHNERAR